MFCIDSLKKVLVATGSLLTIMFYVHAILKSLKRVKTIKRKTSLGG